MAKSDFGMSSLDYWRLCDALSVDQAALLIVGEDPSNVNQRKNETTGFEAARTALINAIDGKRLQADIPVDEEGHFEWKRVTVLVEDLRTWLKSRGFNTGFFFPQPEGPNYLSSTHPNYSQNLQPHYMPGRPSLKSSLSFGEVRP